MGRFLSADKVGGRIRAPQSWNRYSYALNNPLKYLDPDGRAAVGFIGFGGAQSSGTVRIIQDVRGAPGIGRAMTLNSERARDVDTAVRFLATSHAKNPSEAIVVTGHSTGADAALKTAGKLGGMGIKVDLVVTIDPVLGDKSVPPNVGQAVNYFQPGADLGGGQLNPESSSTSVTNIDVQGVAHTTIDEAVAGAAAIQIRELGATRPPPPPPPTCGSRDFVGPCPR